MPLNKKTKTTNQDSMLGNKNRIMKKEATWLDLPIGVGKLSAAQF